MRIRKDIVVAKLVADRANCNNGDFNPIWYTCPYCAAVTPANRLTRNKDGDTRHCLGCLMRWFDRFELRSLAGGAVMKFMFIRSEER